MSKQQAWSMVGVGLAVATGCTGIAGVQDAGPAPDAAVAPTLGFSFREAESVGPEDPSRNGGLALAQNGQEVAVLYFVDLTSTQTCMTPLSPPREVPESDLRVAVSTGPEDGFTTRSVERTRSADGVAAAYSPAGVLTALYAGGENGTGTCAASDLMQAVIPPTGNATVTMVAADGNTGAMCNVIQDSCNTGNVIGKFPQITFGSDGTRFGASMDTHYGFSQQSDLDGSDLEALIGNTLVTVDNSSGSGNFNQLVLAEDGRPAVVYVQLINHTFASIGERPRGIWLARQAADMSWTTHHITTDLPTNQLGAAWHPTQGWAVAYQDNDTADLVLWRSTNGTTWTKESVDVLGNVGRTPAVAYSGDVLLIAYGVCSGPNDPAGSCVPERDGVRLAWKAPGAAQWEIRDIYNEEEFLEGTDIRMVVDANGNPTIAFKSQGMRRVMVMRGRRNG